MNYSHIIAAASSRLGQEHQLSAQEERTKSIGEELCLLADWVFNPLSIGAKSLTFLPAHLH